MRLAPWLAAALVGSSVLQAAGPRAVEVEGQPVAANVARVREALVFLGTPLPPAVDGPIVKAVAEQDAAAIQRTLDGHVTFVVDISPEARVKVAEGPRVPPLQQAGWTPVLVKVINAAAVRSRLGVSSPQAGDVYGGQRRDAPDPAADPNAVRRFAAVEMFSAPPMKAELGGLAVEYAIALVYSSEAGKREVTIGFDAGQGTQDLGFRAETAVLFDVKPAVPVTLRVRDADGAPTVARFTFTDAAGHVYPLQAKRLRPDLFFQRHVYRADGGTVLLPPGEFTVEYGRGPEYRLLTRQVTIVPGTTLEFNLERWVDPAAYGFYSGDHHIHAAGCAHYTSPTEGVMPEDMFLQVKGEGLNVGCCLTWGPCYDFQRKFFDSRPWVRSEPTTVLKYDVEVSGFGSQALGHVNLLNLRDQTYPGSDGTKVKGWPTWTTPLMRWAKAQGAVTGYAHSANGLGVNAEACTRRLFAAADRGAKGHLTGDDAAAAAWPLPEPFATLDADADGRVTPVELRAGTDRTLQRLPNLNIPEMNGIGAQEICVTTALGLCDFISSMDSDRVQEWNCWYHILNCGFPLKVSGETDFPCMSGSRVGQGRVYVHLGRVDAVDYTSFCDGIAAGRSYVSDGYAHCFELALGDGTLGDTVEATAGATLPLTARVTFDPELPLGTAIGGSPPAGRSRTVELVVNGQVAGTREVPADRRLHEVRFDVPIRRSAWVALRSFPQLHTNPVFVRVDGRPIRGSKESARWCVGVIERLWAVRERDIAAAERPEAEKAFREAVAVYSRIASETE